ncbi:MAG: PKD domain-containing protein [Sedimentisphaerales bacterium]|nr:PKD domain-containing protein [Sedimentisphaerales bacterium]
MKEKKGGIYIGLCISLVLAFSTADLYARKQEATNPSADLDSTTVQNVILNHPSWPTVFELNKGEAYRLKRTFQGKIIERTIRLDDVKEYWEPDFWTGNKDMRTLRMAEVIVNVSGVTTTLKCRPYQMPSNVNGLRLYVESTHGWANNAEYAKLPAMQLDVRLSAVAEGEGWGPSSFVFPVEQYRWRSSSYNNTWLSLVPYNHLYYHHGEDFGAIPDHLPVVASLGGIVTSSPLPDGDGESNGLILETSDGIRLRYYHMNIETIDRTLSIGTTVSAGAKLGKTGMTWSGRRSQKYDPHIHFDIGCADTRISSYPFIVESYFRAYPDPLIAVAGGYHFTVPEKTVELDGSRSVARRGQRIAQYEWHLHDGRVVRGATAQLTFEHPGLFSEELIVRTEKGHEERDFAQVRVFDRQRKRNIARGWVYYTPVRGIAPQSPVVFWNRLQNVKAAVHVNFGDGSHPKITKEMITHAYEKPGIYTVTFSTRGPDEEPVTVKTRVVVE